MRDDYEVSSDQMSGPIYRQLKVADRFDNYREINAKFNSTGKCGHAIKKGDTIGWNKRHGCYCSNCWEKWSAENREAEAMEAGYMPNAW